MLMKSLMPTYSTMDSSWTKNLLPNQNQLCTQGLSKAQVHRILESLFRGMHSGSFRKRRIFKVQVFHEFDYLEQINLISMGI